MLSGDKNLGTVLDACLYIFDCTCKTLRGEKKMQGSRRFDSIVEAKEYLVKLGFTYNDNEPPQLDEGMAVLKWCKTNPIHTKRSKWRASLISDSVSHVLLVYRLPIEMDLE